ncbi:MAG: shikimate kinase [Ruminococcus sp.]|nr:shikimate kinase [Ruminococcus sp.]
MTVYLCGFMGCGKTTVGRAAAEKLNCAYADMDAYIEETEKMSIPRIFAEKGEAYFRDAETRAVSEMGASGGIIACGGGAMLKRINAEAAAKNGAVVYIDTPFETCWKRICGDKNRPLVVNNTKESLEELYEARKVLYRENSAFTVSGAGTPSEIADKIIEITSVEKI